jgi:hypothetical protein
VEYILAKYDPGYTCYSARLAAGSLLCEIARVRSKSLGVFLTYCESSLEAYMQAAPAEQNHAMKEGVLYALGSLRLVVRSRQDHERQIFDLVQRFAIPDLSSHIPHLRACACWVTAQYDRILAAKPELLAPVTPLKSCRSFVAASLQL